MVVYIIQEEFDATDIFNSDKVQNACIKASQLILIKTKHTTNEKIQIYIRMLPYYILEFRDILSTKQFSFTQIKFTMILGIVVVKMEILVMKQYLKILDTQLRYF